MFNLFNCLDKGMLIFGGILYWMLNSMSCISDHLDAGTTFRVNQCDRVKNVTLYHEKFLGFWCTWLLFIEVALSAALEGIVSWGLQHMFVKHSFMNILETIKSSMPLSILASNRSQIFYFLCHNLFQLQKGRKYLGFLALLPCLILVRINSEFIYTFGDYK